MVQMGLLGALITFAANPLYAPHFATTLPWGLDPLEDQQLAGLIMWAPAAAIYLAAALFIAGRWLAREAARPPDDREAPKWAQPHGKGPLLARRHRLPLGDGGAGPVPAGLGLYIDWIPPGGNKLYAYQVHSAVGLPILILALLRGAWRIAIPGP
jgi:hypothetical protein